MAYGTNISSFIAPHQQEICSKEQQIPGSVKYSIKRYERKDNTLFEDRGIIAYNFVSKNNVDNSLKLKFCVAGNIYCTQKNCSKCSFGNAKNCTGSQPSLDVVSIKYAAAQLSQFISTKNAHSSLEPFLRFEKEEAFSKSLPLCCKTKAVLEGLVNHPYNGSLENIYVNAQLQMLLLYSMDCLCEKEEVISCRFLSNEVDSQKIVQAREILIQHIGQPITIKELSRKVAMNECYLKKGFKEMYGSTIFDFYQSQRMEHAKYLLYEKGLNVTDVSMMLGYSSISHFSTAFKKQTGLKPCELLLR